MSVVLTEADVERVAALAHLELTEEEKVLFTRQLTEVLSYAAQVQAIDTTGIPPTSHVITRHPAFRDDDPKPSLPRSDALANAPDPEIGAGLFKVPRVIG